MSDSAKFNIFRYDPSVDATPHYEEYEVPWQDDGETDFMSVLQCLTWIYENNDQLSFDSNCGSGWCGRCAMMIDDKPRLACWTRVDKGGTYTIEPLKGFPVIKDLVVDKDVTYQKYVETDVAVQSSTPMTTLIDIDYEFFFNTLYKFNRCRECMCCYSVCPKTNQGVTDRFVGPGAMMQIAMRHVDPNDEADRLWQAAFSGVFECDLCGDCSSACPATIDIVGMMKTLQDGASEKGLQGSGLRIPASSVAVAEAIAVGMANAKPSSSSTTSTANQSVEEIIKTSCGESGCHSSEDILAYRTDADSAKLRVDSHASSNVEMDDAKKQEFIKFFTE